MSIVVSSIVEVSMNKIPLWNNFHVGVWTAEREIIASNDHCLVGKFENVFKSILTDVASAFLVTLLGLLKGVFLVVYKCHLLSVKFSHSAMINVHQINYTMVFMKKHQQIYC